MPHIVIEHSVGAGDVLDMREIARAVHHAARMSGHFAPHVVRTFVKEAAISFVADEHPDNHFVQILMRVAPGRSLEVRKDIAKMVYDVACAVTGDRARLGLRVDVFESNPDLAVSHTTIPVE